MIDSFRHKGLQRLFEDDDRSKLPADMAERIGTILAALDSATELEQLNRPGFRLHLLKGDLKGCWSITVRSNWRIIFRFQKGTVSDVELLDYH